MRRSVTFLTLIFLLTACNLNASPPTIETAPATQTFIPASTTSSPTDTPPTETSTPIPPTETSTPTPIPIVDEMRATVIADKLVCRYGPGANYLYLIAFNKTTPLKLIGQAKGNDWVLVENGPQDCWVNSQFIEAEGDVKQLRSVYPDGYKIPVSPYYGPTTVLKAERDGDKVIVSWIEIIVSPGKYENDWMFPYIVEVWFCQDGEIVFDTLGSRLPFISFTDEAGCDEPSRGRVYIQEKHGYAGPAEIPWPER
ncbi:MAG TPA: hypothetical protein PLF42_15925 [Anaerolineales bacterium]|nr:hypothetical protein [Anaerolineales bacterium]